MDNYVLYYVVKNTSAVKGSKKRKTLGSGAVAKHFVDELGQLQQEGKKEFKLVKRMKNNHKIWEQHGQKNRGKNKAWGMPRKVKIVPWMEHKIHGEL